jgi:2-dehydro-3-deoxygluconokinase
MRVFASMGECIVELSLAGGLVLTAGAVHRVPAEPVAHPVDITCPGDSFNAGYLAARLAWRGPDRSRCVWPWVAAGVIQSHGAW